VHPLGWLPSHCFLAQAFALCVAGAQPDRPVPSLTGVAPQSPGALAMTCVDDPPGWPEFAQKFYDALSRLRKVNRGCVHCLGQCYESFANNLEEIRQFRLGLHALERDDLRDQCLAAIFLPRQAKAYVRLDTTSESEAESAPEACACEGKPVLRADTSSDSSSDEDLDVLAGSRTKHPLLADKPKPEPRKTPKKRKYNSGGQRRPAHSLCFLGIGVCERAAMTFSGMGSYRLARIRCGGIDGRRDGTKKVRGPGGLSHQTHAQPSVLRFLWRLYHSVGEGLPDKFSFERHDVNTLVVQPAGAPKPKKQKTKQQAVRLLMEDEEQERAIAAATLYAESSRAPAESVQSGPGMLRGPVRFLPPQQKIHVYWDYLAWCNGQDVKAASFTTFLRAFRGCREKLRIRKAGSHATCDTCADLKKKIRTAPPGKKRTAAMEEYTRHVLGQWLDRQIYWHAQELSLSCRDYLNCGHRFAALARSVSQCCLIMDGMDQAKFRVPRVLQKTHALDKLLRPALHVQGAWCHGFGYHLAVSDTDMRKDTNNNVEVMARLLSQMYNTHQGLPLGLHIQQDNTSRECKNQLMLRFACKLVALGVFQWVTLAYLITGHTHENLDGSFGQLAVKIAALEFPDDKGLITILLGLLAQLGVDRDSRIASKAYKLDEAAQWAEWWDETNLFFSQVTGPEAPHWFRFCALRDLGEDSSAERAVPLRSLPGLPPEHLDDVVMVVKQRMASTEVLQVVRVFSSADRGRLTLLQPHGQRPRRPDSGGVKAKVARVARELHAARAIEDAARDYLVGWAEGSRYREPRPDSYAFLRHRWQPGIMAQPCLQRMPQRPPRLVQVRSGAVADGRLLPEPDLAVEDDDAEPGALVLAGEDNS